MPSRKDAIQKATPSHPNSSSSTSTAGDSSGRCEFSPFVARVEVPQNSQNQWNPTATALVIDTTSLAFTPNPTATAANPTLLITSISDPRNSVQRATSSHDVTIVRIIIGIMIAATLLVLAGSIAFWCRRRKQRVRDSVVEIGQGQAQMVVIKKGEVAVVEEVKG